MPRAKRPTPITLAEDVQRLKDVLKCLEKDYEHSDLTNLAMDEPDEPGRKYGSLGQLDGSIYMAVTFGLSLIKRLENGEALPPKAARRKKTAR